MPESFGTTNQQSNPGQAHPIVEEVVLHYSGPSTDHYVDMPATVDAGDLLLALTAADDDDTILTPSGWTEKFSDQSLGEIFIGVFCKIAAGTEGGTTVNFAISGASRKFAAQVYKISSWSGSLGDIEYESADETFSPPDVECSWGSFANLWICSIHGSMSQTYSSHPAGYSDLYEIKTGTTISDAQVYSCRVLNVESSMSSGSWIFGAGSGAHFSAQIAIKGATVA